MKIEYTIDATTELVVSFSIWCFLGYSWGRRQCGSKEEVMIESKANRRTNRRKREAMKGDD